ncbi:MAG: hypothetical protein QM774_00805 [Gordonia sp. (in: high G+C Gram-positive bacteria)]|uniref:hypothetical protein n=1 Tax=Gordonia sp. (in: high G+C Gram-positive bacteria) TaxID=84139 RepID=UPI0039E645F3
MAAFLRTAAVRTGLAAVAVSVTAALAAPAYAAPATPSVPGADSLSSISLSNLPGDHELAEALRKVKELGGTDIAVQALQTILQSDGQTDLSSIFGSLGGSGTTPTTPTTPANPTAPAPAPAATAQVAAPVQVADPTTTSPTDGLAALESLTGVKTLSPALAPFCTDPTADNPLGIVSAPAVAIPGPLGLTDSQKSLLDPLKTIPVLGDLIDSNTKDLTVLNDDDTAFALVPPTDDANPKFQVAWFNTKSMQGGIEQLAPLADSANSDLLKKFLSNVKTPLRLAKVKTGQGQILTAVFGTATNAGRTCYFLPALGIVNTPKVNTPTK